MTRAFTNEQRQRFQGDIYLFPNKMMYRMYQNKYKKFLETFSVFPALILLKLWCRERSWCGYFGLHNDMRMINDIRM